eukprot:scaffold315449_cov32-Tisochrysis_lutea.AAC.2
MCGQYEMEIDAMKRGSDTCRLRNRCLSLPLCAPKRSVRRLDALADSSHLQMTWSWGRETPTSFSLRYSLREPSANGPTPPANRGRPLSTDGSPRGEVTR